MLFEIVHTHTNEDCPARRVEQAEKFAAWWQAFKKAPGVNVLAGYVAALEHTFYITVEADDYAAVVKSFGGMLPFGSGRISPIMTLDQTVPLAKTVAGAAK